MFSKFRLLRKELHSSDSGYKRTKIFRVQKCYKIPTQKHVAIEEDVKTYLPKRGGGFILLRIGTYTV